MALIVPPDNKKFFICSCFDVLFLLVRHPDWHAFYDQNGPMAEANHGGTNVGF